MALSCLDAVEGLRSAKREANRLAVRVGNASFSDVGWLRVRDDVSTLPVYLLDVWVAWIRKMKKLYIV